MPYPTQRHIIVSEASLEAGQRAPVPAESLRAFSHLGLAAEGPKGVSGSAVKHYAKGEHVVMEGQRLPGLHLIIRGRVSMTARNAAGHEVEIARLERGEFFGEKNLLSSAPSEATVTALEDLELLVLENDSVHALIEKTPSLSQQIGEVMETRRIALQNARTQRNGA